MINHVLIPIFLQLYNMLWVLALPVLKKNRRLAEGFERRRTSRHFNKADIWIQAASAGEAYLAVRIVHGLSSTKPLKVLITTFTRQGWDILKQHLGAGVLPPGIRLDIQWCPFDTPKNAKAAVRRIDPKVMVLLETEIWPALLFYLKQQSTPILIVNARLSKKSHFFFRLTRGVWNALAPDLILPTSQGDMARYKNIFTRAEVRSMPNIKFEAMAQDTQEIMLSNAPAEVSGAPEKSGTSNTFHTFPPFIQNKLPLTILASIRRQEEKQVTQLIQILLKSVPQQIIALFPRHMHRVKAWEKHLKRHKIPFRKKSFLNFTPDAGPAFADLNTKTSEPGVILWDTFGELKAAYGLAKVVFVGGSLVPLGGQNFIEPAVHGVPTIIGPHYDDFLWVTEDIFDKGLVILKHDINGVAQKMADILASSWDKAERQKTARQYLEAHQGGTPAACTAIQGALNSKELAWNKTGKTPSGR